VTENQPDGLCYWHLTAIAPAFQGRGYGKRVWREMLHFHQREGMKQIATTIAARNTPVLNLYASLGFRFQPPEITLHWLRDA
jgi:RimJ/RimL family protein N-acetyltransferase